MFRMLTALVAAAAIFMPMEAMSLDSPKGKVVLTISGKSVSNPNAGDTAQFDLEMLEALAGRTATMETMWLQGEHTFSGPFLREVLKAAGASGSSMKISALNEYYAIVPMEDADLDTILATRIDGKKLSVRDKGPLFLIYPFDLDQSLRNEKYFNRSVWQIKEIEVQ
jgi:Uncharacterized protein conserved in bacteria